MIQIAGHRNTFQKIKISSISLLKCWSCYTSQLSFLYIMSDVNWCFIEFKLLPVCRLSIFCMNCIQLSNIMLSPLAVDLKKNKNLTYNIGCSWITENCILLFNTRSAKAVNLTTADFWLSISLNPYIVLTRHVLTFHYIMSTIRGSQIFPHLVPLLP